MGRVRNKATDDPWEENTMVIVHSTTKGLAAMTLALAHSRGWLDYDAPVCKYWPEFAQNGKEKITVRQLLGPYLGPGVSGPSNCRTVIFSFPFCANSGQYLQTGAS